MTSSPSPIPSRRNAISAHAVCELRHTARLTPQYSATRLSNSFTFGPVVIHPDLKASVTASISAVDISGGEKGIVIVLTPKVIIYTYIIASIPRFVNALL
jgi:hypothetical protein